MNLRCHSTFRTISGTICTKP